jgi:hypothetical protein
MTLELDLKKLTSGDYDPGYALLYDKFSDKEAQLLAEALKSGKCTRKLNIDLAETDIGDEGVKALASVLASGKFPPEAWLNLIAIKIGVEGIKALASALESGNCPEGFSLHLCGNDIGVEGVKALASALQSGNCPSGYRLCLGDTGDPEVDSVLISDAGADAFVTALASGKYRTGFGLVIDCPGISERQDEKFAEVLSSGSCPYGTEVVSNHRSYHESSRSNNNRINAEKGRALATIIGRYEGMNETKKIKAVNDNVTKSCFHLFPDPIFQIIASFLPGSVTVKKVRSEIKLASETACNKVFRETIESTIRDFVRKNTYEIFNDASTSFNRRRDVPHLFFNEFLPTYKSFKLTNVTAKIIDENENEDDDNNSKDNNSNSLTL